MEKLAHSIKEFCFQHDISKSKFYDLCRHGLAPKMIQVDKRRLISVESAKEWRELLSVKISCGGDK